MVQGIPPRQPQVNSHQASFGQNQQRAGNDQQQDRDQQIAKILQELLGKQGGENAPQQTASAAPASGGGGGTPPAEGAGKGDGEKKLTLADFLELAKAMLEQQGDKQNKQGGNETQFAQNGGNNPGGGQQPGFGRLNAMA